MARAAGAASDETDAVSYTEARTGMSARSSSDSWPGRQRAPDIIDLDRYMRGSVRPHNRHHADDPVCDRLVVDAGGPTAAPGGPLGVPMGGPRVGSVAGSVRVASPRPVKSSSTTSAPRDKRYSHDSGLSDGSYVRRRTHRRALGESATLRMHRDREQKRERVSSTSANSMRTFRATCERALREQQEQIARVAQLCERLTNNDRGGGGAAPPEPARKTSISCTQDSSDISSSTISRSTRDKSRRDRDKHRSNECKTYKIIMNKLDELNRLFMARARSSPPARRSPAPPRAASGGSVSVSVSDKLVSTEPQDRHHGRPPRSVAAYAMTEARPVLVSPRTPQSVAHSTIHRRPPPNLVERGVGGERGCGGRAALARLAAARAHELDIAPDTHRAPNKTRSGWLNVATESVMECESDGDGSTAQAPHCKYDLDNPLHLYYQAKRLQKAQKPGKRAHSLTHDDTHMYSNEKSHNHYMSLCGRCQNYWRALTALATQLFTRNEKEPEVF